MNNMLIEKGWMCANLVNDRNLNTLIKLTNRFRGRKLKTMTFSKTTQYPTTRMTIETRFRILR